jgi:hypothetical protein
MSIHLGGPLIVILPICEALTRVDYWLHFDGWTIQWCIINPKLGLKPNFYLGYHQDIVGNH